VGDRVGNPVGPFDGAADWASVGDRVGNSVGPFEGNCVGNKLGNSDGNADWPSWWSRRQASSSTVAPNLGFSFSAVFLMFDVRDFRHVY
jgi:hypothetical protein